jgi:F-type H+-transporting ATPase subunit epsilon
VTTASEIHLLVVTPTGTLVDDSAAEVYLKTMAGYFGILPRHADFATALTPGIFEYRAVGGERYYVAADGGAAVKQGAEIVVATGHGAASADLSEVERGVAERFEAIDDRERQMHEAMQRLEASLMHGMWKMANNERRT